MRNKIASGNSLQQRKSQLFWGLPSLHSESLETIFLSSDGPSPLKLSICPSVFFNKVAFLPVYNLLLPYYHSPTYYPTPEAHTMRNLEGMAAGSQLVQSPPSPLIPSVSSTIKPLPIGCKGIISDTEAHTQWFTQQKEVPCVSENQDLHPQPERQKIRSSTFLYSSEAWMETPGDPSLLQQNPESPSASLMYPSNPQEVLTRFDAPWITMKQHEYPKASESAMPTASPHPTSLTEYQRTNPIGDLSGLKALWETTGQNKNPQICKLPISTLCQFTVPMTEPQGTGPPGTPPGYEAQWGITQHKDNPQTSDPLMPVSCQPSGFLSEVENVNPKGRHPAPKDFWGSMGYRESPPVSRSPVSVPCPPLNTLSEHHRPLEHLSAYKPQQQHRENSGNLWAFETPTLNFNVGFYEANPACLPLGSEAPPQRINTVDGFPRSEATWKDPEQTRKCLSSEPSILNFNPTPVLVQSPLRVSPIENLFKSKASCGDTQRKNNFLASEHLAQSLSQHLLGASSSGVLSEPAGGYMKQNENCISESSVWESSPPPHSVLKSHISELSGDPCNYKPMESAEEQRKDSWATELPDPSFLSAHPNTEFVCQNVQERQASQAPSPPVVNPLQPTSWTPILAKALKSESIQPGLQKEKTSSEAKEKAPSSQGGAVSGVCDHPVSHAWQWSRELKLILKKLQQSPTFKPSGPQRPLCSSSALNSTPESWGLSSCPQHQTHLLSLHPCSASSGPPKVQRTEPQPVQAPHCPHSSSSRAEQESQINKRIKRKKIRVQTPSPGNVHIKDNENCSGMGEPSNIAILISSKRQDKTSVLLSAPKKGSPRKFKAEKHGGTARLGSSPVTREQLCPGLQTNRGP